MVTNIFLPAAYRNAFLEDFNRGLAAIEGLPSRLYAVDELISELQTVMNPNLAALWRINLLFATLQPRTYFSKQQILEILREFGASFEPELSPPGGH